jgi:hypothetical protein
MRAFGHCVVGALMGIIGSALPAAAQTYTSGSTGADGAFSPASSTTVTLPASGVFNYTTVNIPAGVTVRFARNATNTPVTILATGDVTIAGTIDISGALGGSPSGGTVLGTDGGAGGPGGFDGGTGSNGIISTTGGTGLGPGGGAGGVLGSTYANAAGAGFLVAGGDGLNGVHGGSAYGSPNQQPLIGGSGGGGGGSPFGNSGAGGGGGAGGLLIGASGTITVSGSILARGGDGGGAGPSNGGSGSGGGVRLVATTMAGSGTINVSGGSPIGGTGAGSAGRVRIESYHTTAAFTFGSVPTAAISVAMTPSPALANVPTLAITSVGGVTAPAAAGASFATPDVTLPPGTTNPVTVVVAATNIPTGTVVNVTVVGFAGATTSATATLTGTSASSSASVALTLPTNQPSVISATTSFTITSSAGTGPAFVDGEEVERVRVSATAGDPAHVAYVTRSGREVSLLER